MMNMLLQNMMGKMLGVDNGKMAEAMKWANQQASGKQNLEQYVRDEFKKSGLNPEDVMKQFGMGF